MDEIGIYHGSIKYNPVKTDSGLGSPTITPSYLPDPTGNHFTTTGSNNRPDVGFTRE